MNTIVLPKPGVRVSLSPPQNAAVLRGVTVHPENPFKLEFIVDQGDQVQQNGYNQDNVKVGYNKLIKYFLASLTTPENDLWVNLSPYEKQRIVPSQFGQTEMGRDLLAQDYLLKQVTASLMYPEDGIGKTFWKKIYQKVKEKYGVTTIPINTFNKVWITPNKAALYEKGNTVFIAHSSLKVMLEEDYVAMNKNRIIATSAFNQRQPGDMLQSEQQSVSPSRLPSKIGLARQAPQVNPQTTHQPSNNIGNKPNETTNNIIREIILPATSRKPLDEKLSRDDLKSSISSSIIREIILPALEIEINEGKNFAQLRQIYQSLILAAWYKRKVKESIITTAYKDKNKISGLGFKNNGESASDDVSPQKIYHMYLQAFQKGVFNYIKEEQDPFNGQRVLHKYFSGGFTAGRIEISRAMTTASKEEAHQGASTVRAVNIVVNLDRINTRPLNRAPLPNAAMVYQPALIASKAQLALTNAEKETIGYMLKRKRFLYRDTNADGIDAKLAQYIQEKKGQGEIIQKVRVTIHNQDDINRLLKTTVITSDGKEQRQEGDLVKILKNGGIILLDFNGSNPTLALKFNSLFGRNPSLFGIKINPQISKKIHVIGVMDDDNVKKLSSDLYERFVDKPSKRLETAPVVLPDEISEDNLDGRNVYNLWESPDVMEALIGSFTLHQGRVIEKKGALIEALDRGVPLVIANGVWEDIESVDGNNNEKTKQVSSLRLLVNKINQEGGYRFNGKFYPVKSGFAIYRSTTNFSEGISGKTIRRVSHEEGNGEGWIINSSNQQVLFKSTRINDHKQIEEDLNNALLNKDRVHLVITERLEDWVWHRIMHAKGKVTIDVRPGVYIPQVYSKNINNLPDTPREAKKSWEDVREKKVVQIETDDELIAVQTVKKSYPNATVFPVTTGTTREELFISPELSRPNKKASVREYQFTEKQQPILEELLSGKTVILTGVEYNPMLLRSIESALQENPYLVINGQRHYFTGRLILIRHKGAELDLDLVNPVAIEGNDETLQTMSGLTKEDFEKVIKLREALKDKFGQQGQIDFSLQRLKRLAQSPNKAKALATIFAQPLYNQLEMAAFIRVMGRKLFSETPANPNSINFGEVLNILNRLKKEQTWESVGWQLADTLSADVVNRVIKSDYSKEDFADLFNVIKNAIVEHYRNSDSEHYDFYINRFKLSKELATKALTLKEAPALDRVTGMDAKIDESLNESPLLILIGFPGTGKSRAARNGSKGNAIVGPVTTGPDTRPNDIIITQEIVEMGTAYVLQAVAQWANLPQGGRLIIDEGNLTPNGFWNFLKGMFAPNDPHIWINGQKKGLTPNHHVIITGNNYELLGRHHHDIFEQYGTTLYFNQYNRAHLKAIISSEEKPYIPQSVDHKDKFIEKILDAHLFFDSRLSGGKLSLRDIQELIKRVAIRAKNENRSWNNHDIVIEAWGIYQGHFNQFEQRALRPVIKQYFNVDLEAVEQQEEDDLRREFGDVFKQRGLVLTSTNIASIKAIKRLIEMSQERMKDDPDKAFEQLDGKRGSIIEGLPALGKDEVVLAILQAMGFKNVLDDDKNDDPTKNYYLIDASIKPDDIIAIIEQAKEKGAKVILPEMNALPSAFLEGKLNDALTGFNKDGSPVHPGFSLIATINPTRFKGREELSSALLNRVTYVTLNDYQEKEILAIISAYSQKLGLNLSDEQLDLLVKAHCWVRDHIAAVNQRPTLRILEQVLDTYQENNGLDKLHDVFKEVYGPHYLTLTNTPLISEEELATYRVANIDQERLLEKVIDFLSPKLGEKVPLAFSEKEDQQPYIHNENTIVVPKNRIMDPVLTPQLAALVAKIVLVRSKSGSGLHDIIHQWRAIESLKLMYPSQAKDSIPLDDLDVWLNANKTKLTAQKLIMHLVSLVLHGKIDAQGLRDNREAVDDVFDESQPIAWVLKHLDTLNSLRNTLVSTVDEEEILYQEYQADVVIKKLNEEFSEISDTAIEIAGAFSPEPKQDTSPKGNTPEQEQLPAGKISIHRKSLLERSLNWVKRQKLMVMVGGGVAAAVGGMALMELKPTAVPSANRRVEKLLINTGVPLTPPKAVISSQTTSTPGATIINTNQRSAVDEHYFKLMQDIKGQYSLPAIEQALAKESLTVVDFTKNVLKGYLLALADNGVTDEMQDRVQAKAKAINPPMAVTLQNISQMLQSNIIDQQELIRLIKELRRQILAQGVYIEVHHYLDRFNVPYIFVDPMPVVETFTPTPSQVSQLTRGLTNTIDLKAYVVDDRDYSGVDNHLRGIWNGEQPIVYGSKALLPGLPAHVSYQFTALHELGHGVDDFLFKNFNIAVGNNPELFAQLVPLMYSDDPGAYYIRTIWPRAQQADVENMYSQGSMAIKMAFERVLKERNITVNIDDWMQRPKSPEVVSQIQEIAKYIYARPDYLGPKPDKFKSAIDQGTGGISSVENGGPQTLVPKPIMPAMNHGVQASHLNSSFSNLEFTYLDALYGALYISIFIGGFIGSLEIIKRRGHLIGKYEYEKMGEWFKDNLEQAYLLFLNIASLKDYRVDSKQEHNSPAVLKEKMPGKVLPRQEFAAEDVLMREMLGYNIKESGGYIKEIFMERFSRSEQVPVSVASDAGIDIGRLIETGDPETARAKQIRFVPKQGRIKTVYIRGPQSPDDIDAFTKALVYYFGFDIRYFTPDYTEDDLKQSDQSPNSYEIISHKDFLQEFIKWIEREIESMSMSRWVENLIAKKSVTTTNLPNSNKTLLGEINAGRYKRSQYDLLAVSDAFGVAPSERDYQVSVSGAISIGVYPSLDSSRFDRQIRQIKTFGLEEAVNFWRDGRSIKVIPDELNNFPFLKQVELNVDNLTAREIARAQLKHPNWRAINFNYPHTNESISLNDVLTKRSSGMKLSFNEKILLREFRLKLELDQQKLRIKGLDGVVVFGKGLFVPIRNGVSTEILEILAKSNIDTVRFIGTADLTNISPLFKINARALEFDHADENVVNDLNGNPWVEKLEIHVTGSGVDNVFFGLNDLPNLKELSLSGSADFINDETVRYLYFDRFPHLLKISLEDNKRRNNKIIYERTKDGYRYHQEEDYQYLTRFKIFNVKYEGTGVIILDGKSQPIDANPPILDRITKITVEDDYKGPIGPLLAVCTRLEEIVAPRWRKAELEEAWRNHPNRRYLVVWDEDERVMPFSEVSKRSLLWMLRYEHRNRHQLQDSSGANSAMIGQAPLQGMRSKSLKTGQLPEKSKKVGGIDLNPNAIDMSIQSDKAMGSKSITFTPKAFDHIHIEGLKPTIIEITPIDNLSQYLGLI